MPFKKKVYSRCDGSGVPVIQDIAEESQSIVNGSLVVASTIKKIDVTKEFPSYPDVDTFNDLESQLQAGVPLSRVNTVVLDNTDVAEANSELEILVESNPLKSNENENED